MTSRSSASRRARSATTAFAITCARRMEEFAGGNGPADIDWFLERSSLSVRASSKRRKPTRRSPACSMQGRNVLFYLATPPSEFAVDRRPARQGRPADGKRPARGGASSSKSRSATTCPRPWRSTRRSCSVAREEQIFRIDHYLGKETVQNIMVFRFANGIFEPLWNRHHIDHVQITVAETVGVEQRGKFYDATGALRDMVPNHLFQLLAADRDGAAELASTPTRCAARRPRCIEAIRAGFGARDARSQRRARPVRRGHDHGEAVLRLSPGARRRRPIRRPRPTSPCKLQHRQLALGRRAVLPAHRQGAGAAAHRDRHPLQAGALRAVPRHAGRAPDRPTDLILRIQPDEGMTLELRRQDSRARR